MDMVTYLDPIGVSQVLLWISVLLPRVNKTAETQTVASGRGDARPAES